MASFMPKGVKSSGISEVRPKRDNIWKKTPVTPSPRLYRTLRKRIEYDGDSDASSGRRTVFSEPQSATKSKLATQHTPSMSKIDYQLDEAAEEAKKSSLRKMLRDAKRRKRDADAQLPATELERIKDYQKDFETKKNLLKQCDIWITSLEEFQDIIEWQLNDLRKERRKRLKSMKAVRTTLRQLTETLPSLKASEQAQQEIKVLEGKLEEF